MTDQMIRVGKIVSIPGKDHLIISTEGYYSFERKGDLKRLKKGIEKGAKVKALEMAKNLKENAVDISLIVKSSGLSKEEIEKL